MNIWRQGEEVVGRLVKGKGRGVEGRGRRGGAAVLVLRWVGLVMSK